MLTNEPSIGNDGQIESNKYRDLAVESRYNREIYIQRKS
jgi:hypothetical protein